MVLFYLLCRITHITMGAPNHQSFKKKKLLPATHLVDSGCVEAKWIVQSANEEKVQIVGPPRPNNQWQSLSKNGFALNDFTIDWENKQVTYPTGQTTANWYPR